MSETNISLVITGCKQKNPASEKKLFDLFYAYVRSICLRYGSSSADADEMLNDSFYNIFRYIEKYNKDFPFKPWLRKVCINCCLQHNRKYINQKKNISFDKLNPIDNQLFEESNFELEPSKALLLLNKLPTQYRLVFNLYVFEEYKHQEIAKKLNISVGTSKSNLSRAKNFLKKMINEDKLYLDFKKKLANG